MKTKIRSQKYVRQKIMKLAIILSSPFNLTQLIRLLCYPCPVTEYASESDSLPETCEDSFANVSMACPAKWVLQSLEIIENTF